MKDSTFERLMMIKCNSKVPIIYSEGKGSTKQKWLQTLSIWLTT